MKHTSFLLIALLAFSAMAAERVVLFEEFTQTG
jgi:hypothetical protein